MAAGFYAIEVWGPNNESLIFPPAGLQSIRGRWDWGILAHKDLSAHQKGIAQAVRFIPGRVIKLTPNQKSPASSRGEILDPLGETQEGKEILAKVQKAMSEFPEVFGKAPQKSHPTQTFNLDIDGIKTWAFYMRDALDSNLARLVPGSDPLPTLDAIKSWPGRRASDPLCSRPKTARTADEARDHPHLLYPWADEVPAGNGKELAGAGVPAGSNKPSV